MLVMAHNRQFLRTVEVTKAGRQACCCLLSTSTTYCLLSKRRFWQGDRPEWKASNTYEIELDYGKSSPIMKSCIIFKLLKYYIVFTLDVTAVHFVVHLYNVSK